MTQLRNARTCSTWGPIYSGISRHALRGVLLCLLAGPSWSSGLAGNWKPVLDAADPRTNQLLRISLTPLDDEGGFRYAEGGEAIYEAKSDGRLHPALNGEPLEYELHAESGGEVSVKTVRENRAVQWRAMRVAEEGKALLVSITSWNVAEQEVKEDLYYRRVPGPECGTREGDKPELALYGCWLWLDGQRKLARQPEPITIEEENGSYRLISPTQTIQLYNGGSAALVPLGNSRKESSGFHWKKLKQGVEITVVARTDRASGTMRLELSDPNTLSVRVSNANGSENSYTYQRQ